MRRVLHSYWNKNPYPETTLNTDNLSLILIDVIWKSITNNLRIYGEIWFYIFISLYNYDITIIIRRRKRIFRRNNLQMVAQKTLEKRKRIYRKDIRVSEKMNQKCFFFILFLNYFKMLF